MKSRWDGRRTEQPHPPVEMRFVDMFMTALGSLIFIALLLVFLLPKAAQPANDTSDLRQQLNEAQEQLRKAQRDRDDMAHQLKNVREVDKHVIKRWMSVLLLTKGCPGIEPTLQVRWEGPLSEFATGKAAGTMPEFDASDPKMSTLIGRRYVLVGAGLPQHEATAPTSLLEGTNVSAVSYVTVSNAPGSWSIYVGIRDPRALGGKDCVVHPIITASSGKSVDATFKLSLSSPFAWIRRVRIENEGEFKAPAPRDDAAFLRELAAFSREQSQKLCEKKSICDTEDAHWALLRPQSEPQQDTLTWKVDHRVDGTAAVAKKDNLTRQECARACTDDAKCEAVEYVKPSRSCNIFTALPKIAASTLGRHSPTDVGLKSLFSRHDNHDVIGADLRRLELVEEDACKSACSKESECKAYSYDKWNRWCFLKSAVSQFRIEPNTVTALRGEQQKPPLASLPVDMIRYRNKAFAYSWQSTTSAESLDECETRCKKSSSCIALTYFKKTKQCRLMDSTTGAPVADESADSSAKRQEPKS